MDVVFDAADEYELGINLSGISPMKTNSPILAFAILAMAAWTPTANASVAYGSINNFDTVNDTGSEAHGFEIELDDCRSSSITYTYDWNHYGTPSITEDLTDPAHPRTTIRWASKKNPDGSWAAYTAIPAGPIAPTDGHRFTNPAVNFGGEHFGAGYYGNPSAIRYHWLIDDGTGNLVSGGAVQVATPVFTYYPPPVVEPGQPPVPAQVVAEIEPPEPAEIPDPEIEFGPAVWVKEIRTTSHNNNPVGLRDLVSDDPDDSDDVNWANGEPDEVEVEWQLLQKDYNKADGGANAVLQGNPEELPDGDEVVTRRYEFFKYIGPFDDESGEAMAQNVAPDDIHGEGVKTINGVEVDLATVEVVGEYAGSQMAAFDAAGSVGLIDHLQDGGVNEPYPERLVVIPGAAPFTATSAGDLPPGMVFNTVSGILSGTPEVSGTFMLTVTASDTAAAAEVTKNFTLQIAPAGEVLPQQYQIDTTASPETGGFTSGGGVYPAGGSATLVAHPAIGYAFSHWTDNHATVGTSSSLVLSDLVISHSLVAHFIPTPVMTVSSPLPGSFKLAWPIDPPGWILQESPDMAPGSWFDSPRALQEAGGIKSLTIPAPAGNRFFRLTNRP